MKQILLALLVLLFASGCVDKKRVLNIQNEGLCSAEVATLYLNEIEIKNGDESFHITEDEIRDTLAKSLKTTGCFRISLDAKEKESLNVESEYLLDTKANLFREEEISEKNIFKDEERELLQLIITLHAHNKTKDLTATTKSELTINRSKILGFTITQEQESDKNTVLTNAAKKISILLQEGFSEF
ncbi:hypothetical protein FCU45_00620 [Sulfurimonas crateris]|uniref:Lipoprotein n=1 Tax=Sulfurimonas crateris TaxID=2574727 RepID=A0A4U2Z9C6_9BACT|nr:hypothetical protein [Sulfurimonas crateris]TKI70927.1 hypothetical protein FCU45_00620 [Sulfurimonas crateris]